MEIGQIIKDRYIVKEKVGSGGMADVFLVTDKILRKDFAMKMIKEKTKVSNVDDRFKAEANVLAKINSKNVVEIHDAFLEEDQDGTRKYIVMEYVDGPTLDRYMKKMGIIDNKNAINLVGQILNALRDMHKFNIYHRDIKPQNILISYEGVIKVIDFGIVKTPESIQLTKTNNVVGSVQYIAPEVLSGEKESELSDIYSTGIIFYRMLTGVIPFDGTDMMKIMKAKLSQSPEPIRMYNEKVDPKLATIVMRSIARETEYRYQTAEDMLRDIKRYLEGKSLLATTQLRTSHLSRKEKNSLDDKKLKKELRASGGQTSIIKRKLNKLNKKHLIMLTSAIGLILIVVTIILVTLL